MKTFAEIRTTINEASSSDMRNWVFDHLENTEMDSGQMKAAFIKKFGKENLKSYEKYVSEYVD